MSLISENLNKIKSRNNTDTLTLSFPFDESSFLLNNQKIIIYENPITQLVSETGILLEREINQNFSRINQFDRNEMPIFLDLGIDLDFDYGTDFIYDDIKIKKGIIKKIDDVNFAEVFEDDF
ncbi:MAG: hypothetical protein ACTSQO_06340 [Candidatus Helarchaeota archaeon]